MNPTQVNNRPLTFEEVTHQLSYSQGCAPTPLQLTIARELWDGVNRGDVISRVVQGWPDRSVAAATKFVDRIIHHIGWDLRWRSISATRYKRDQAHLLKLSVARLASASVVDRPDIQTVLARLGEHEPWEEWVAVSLWNGDTMSQAERIVTTSQSKVRYVAEKIGWDLNWRRCCHTPSFKKKEAIIGRRAQHGTGTVKLTATQCVELYVKGNMTLREIGELAGVSRERVRQVLESTGQKLAVKRAEKRRADRLAAKALAKQERQDFYRQRFRLAHEKEIELYRQGVPIRDIAVQCGKSLYTLSTDMHRGRVKYGYFLPRRKEHGVRSHPREPRVVERSETGRVVRIVPSQRVRSQEDKRRTWRVCAKRQRERYTWIYNQLTPEEKAAVQGWSGVVVRVRQFKYANQPRYSQLYSEACKAVSC